MSPSELPDKNTVTVTKRKRGGDRSTENTFWKAIGVSRVEM